MTRFDSGSMLLLWCSQDTDLIEPLRIVKHDLGLLVGVGWLEATEPGRKHKRVTDFVRHVTPSMLKRCQVSRPGYRAWRSAFLQTRCVVKSGCDQRIGFVLDTGGQNVDAGSCRFALDHRRPSPVILSASLADWALTRTCVLGLSSMHNVHFLCWKWLRQLKGLIRCAVHPRIEHFIP